MTINDCTCRSCGNKNLASILSLGKVPLANSLVAAGDLDQQDPRYPLELVICPECFLVQITVSVPPEEIFSHYLYFSSFSDTMVEHARRLADRLTVERGLTADSLVIEVASNDGYLLQHYKKAGVPVLGIEAAANVAEVAERERGIPTLVDFFDHALAKDLASQGKKADIIHANNVLAHVPDLNGFVAGLGLVIKEDGLIVVEVPYVKNMLGNRQFDTIYHEHLCYFSVIALDRLFKRHGLTLLRVEKIPIHGGSLRLFVTRNEHARSDQSVARIMAEEQKWGLDDLAIYLGFGERVERLKIRLIGLLADLKNRGAGLAAYGAAAKATILLNAFGIGPEVLDFVADRSTYKQGKYIPGVRLPIIGPEALLDRQPDYVLLLAWNFAEEIMSQQVEYHNRGGKFIIPIPKPRII